MTSTLPPLTGDPDPTVGAPVLDHPVWTSLTGAHRRLAERHHRAARYHPDVAGFAALSDPTGPGAWADLAALVGPGVTVALSGVTVPPPGWTEISAVCTDPDHRGQGLAGRLVSAVGAGIAARGERALLHAWAGNVAAIRLYDALGFRLRRTTRFGQYTTPTDQP